MSWRKIVVVILFILFGIYIGVGTIQSIKSNSVCKLECGRLGALTFDLIAGGGLSISNDVCVCYFEDSIKSFKNSKGGG